MRTKNTVLYKREKCDSCQPIKGSEYSEDSGEKNKHKDRQKNNEKRRRKEITKCSVCLAVWDGGQNGSEAAKLRGQAQDSPQSQGQETALGKPRTSRQGPAQAEERSPGQALDLGLPCPAAHL